MHAELEDFKTGWFGLRVGLTEGDISALINKLSELRRSKSHFHARSDFSGQGGVGDIEFYWADDTSTQELAFE